MHSSTMGLKGGTQSSDLEASELLHPEFSPWHLLSGAHLPPFHLRREGSSPSPLCILAARARNSCTVLPGNQACSGRCYLRATCVERVLGGVAPGIVSLSRCGDFLTTRPRSDIPAKSYVAKLSITYADPFLIPHDDQHKIICQSPDHTMS